jgi:hypothetical protein
MEDKNNLDAFIQAAFLCPFSQAIELLEQGERNGELSSSNISSPNESIFQMQDAKA